MEVRLSGVIIALNEEAKISNCLASMKEVVDEIVVVDSFSTDRTVEIAKSYGARVFSRAFTDFIDQKNFAIEKARYDHILYLEADEYLSDELVESVRAEKKDFSEDGYIMNRLSNFCGKWLQYSWYPDRKIRLWDRRKGCFGGENPHDKVVLIKGATTRKLRGDIHHLSYSSLSEFYNQSAKFSELAARAKFARGKKASVLVHLILNPIYKFVRKYIFRLGFLDGYYGFVYCVMGAMVNYMKYARLRELWHNPSAFELPVIPEKDVIPKTQHTDRRGKVRLERPGSLREKEIHGMLDL